MSDRESWADSNLSSWPGILNYVLYLSSSSPGISWRSTAASMSTTAALSAVVIPVVWRFSTAEIPDSRYKLWKLKNDIKIIRMQKNVCELQKVWNFFKIKMSENLADFESFLKYTHHSFDFSYWINSLNMNFKILTFDSLSWN